MDFIATDTFSPPSRSSMDGSPRSVRTAPPPSSSGIRKHFSAVLQRVRGEEGRGDRREADDIRSSNKSHDKPQVNEAKGRDGFSIRTDRADAPSSKTSEKDRSDGNINKSAQASRKDVTRKDGERSTVEDDARSDSPSAASQSVSAPTPVPIATQTINQEQIPTEEDPRSSKDERQATTASSMSTLIPSEAPMPSMTAPETHKGDSSSDRAATQSKDQPKQTSAMPAHSTKSDAQTGPIVKDDVQAVIGGAAIKTAVAAVETHAAFSGQETGRSRPQSDGLSQSQSNLNSGPVSNDGGINRSMNDAARIMEGISLARPASPHSDGHAPSHGGKEDAKSKTEVVLPLEDLAQFFSDDGSGESKVSAALLRGHQSSFDVTKHFVELKAGQIGSPHDQAETELPQAAVGEHQVTGGQPTGSTISGTHGGAASSSPPPPPTTPFVSHAQPAMPGHDPGDKSTQVMMRSVVFDVAQPDLGHVNVRVAMTNDVVHTHLSADRPEVGQFLISGQDRLQAALQANGLDMGQFRVQVDREWTSQGGHEWLSRNDDNPAHQQRDQPRQQDQPVNSLIFDQESVRVLSVFA